MKTLFEYDNYRIYLRDYYDREKADKPYFSYQYLADKAGFKSKSFLYRIITQERRMSAASIIKLSRALKHSRDEAEYFENLVGYNQAKSEQEREHYFSRLIRVAKRQEVLPERALITPDQYELYSNWYHQVVRSIIDMYDFGGDYQWLASMLYPAITGKQASDSVALLLRLGLIAQEEDGRWHSVQQIITTGAQVQRHALRAYYGTCLQLAKQSMNGVIPERRNLSGLTLGVSEKTYEKMVERLAEVRQELVEMAVNDSGADRVYNLNMQLYPVSGNEHGRLK